jgi:hypothetical protein
MDDSFKPKFVRRYEHLGTRIRTAVDAYINDVRQGSFPSDNESFFLDPGKRPKSTPAKVAPLSALAHAGVPMPQASRESDGQDSGQSSGHGSGQVTPITGQIPGRPSGVTGHEDPDVLPGLYSSVQKLS